MENNVVYESTTVHNRKMGYIIFILLPIIGVVITVLSMIPVSTVYGKHFIDHNNMLTIYEYFIYQPPTKTKKGS